jgi:hypothetical protein
MKVKVNQKCRNTTANNDLRCHYCPRNHPRRYRIRSPAALPLYCIYIIPRVRREILELEGTVVAISSQRQPCSAQL